MVRGSRQILLGLLFLVVGGGFAAVTIMAGLRVVPAIGLVLAVWGIVLLVNALLGQRLPTWPWGSVSPSRSPEGEREPESRAPHDRRSDRRPDQPYPQPHDQPYDKESRNRQQSQI